MQTWRPDTCGCYIEEIYEAGSIKGGGQIMTKCVVHATVPDAELYDTLLAENRIKNRVFRFLCGLDGVDLKLSKMDPSGAVTLKDGVEDFWTFSGSGKGRQLAISVSGVTLTTTQKTAIKNFIDAQFGAGKLSLV